MGDQPLLNEAVVNLLLEGLKFHDSQIRVDARQCVADSFFKPGH